MADIILCDTPSLVFGVHAKDWREVNYVVGISLSKQEYTFQLFVSVLVTNLVLYPIITWCFITLLRYFMFVDSFPIVTSVITPKKHGQGQACHESRNKDTNALGAHKKQTIFFYYRCILYDSQKVISAKLQIKNPNCVNNCEDTNQQSLYNYRRFHVWNIVHTWRFIV